MRMLSLNEQSLVAGGRIAQPLLYPPIGTGGNDSDGDMASDIGEDVLGGIDEGLYDSSFAENFFLVTDVMQVSAAAWATTYDVMVNDCTYWEDVGPGSHTPSPQGAVFDVRYINWSAYDGGGSVSCQQAVINMVGSLQAGNKLSIDPNYQR